MSLRSVASNPAYRFVGLFAFYLAVLSLGYPWLTKRFIGVLGWATTNTAVIENAILSLVSDEASLTGTWCSWGRSRC